MARDYYFGDPCYVLSHDVYDTMCRILKLNDYKQCSMRVNGETLMACHTAVGDGEYPCAITGAVFMVDSGNLALVPASLIARYTEQGRRLTSPRPLRLEVTAEGVFRVLDDTGRVYLDVDTRDSPRE